MILRNLKANNVLKYERLEVTDVPDPGIVAISGANESGKSTVGETICFAIFGRTFMLDSSRTRELVRWGEIRADLTLEFEVHGERWLVYREIDTDGNHLAKLYPVGREAEVTIGAGAVNAQICRMAGFTFQQFCDSFYLPQRESGQAAERPQTIKNLIGLDLLEETQARLQREIAENHAQIRSLQGQIAETGNQMASLGVVPGDLERLQATKGETEARRHGLAEERGRLEKSLQQEEGALQAYRVVAEKLQDPPAAGDPASRLAEKAAALAAAVDRIDALPEELRATLDSPEGRNHAHQVRRLQAAQRKMNGVHRALELAQHRIQYLLADEGPIPPGLDVRPQDRFSQRRREREAEVRRRHARRGPVALVALVLLILAAVAWVGWYSIGPAATGAGENAGLPAPPWLDQVRQVVTAIPWVGTTEGGLPAMGVAALLSLAAVMGWAAWVGVGREVKAARLGVAEMDARAEQARAELAAAAAIGDEAPSAIVDRAEALSDVGVADAVGDLREGDGTLFLDAGALSRCVDDVRRDGQTVINRLTARVQDQRARLGQLAQELDQLVGKLSKVEAQMQQVRDRLAERSQLETTAQGLQKTISDLESRIEVKKLAEKLAEGTRYQIQKRFTPELRRFVGRLLPAITNGKYQHSQIDENLSVRVFSGDKNNFLALEEISGGTYRQLLLCIRLALAQALIDTSVRDRQFVFLDEPFAFFDEERASLAALALPHISERLTQFFVVAQQFARQIQFNLHLELSADQAELVARGGGSGSGAR